MKTDILFTKYYPKAFFAQHFGSQFHVVSLDFIQTEMTDLNEIKAQLKPNIQKYIVSSVRAAEYIKSFQLLGEFFCVGEKSAKILQNAEKTVTFSAKTASELVEFIQNNVSKPELFQFFCSSIRRDEIPNKLKKSGYEVNEVITYKTTPQPVQLIQTFQAYVFFSPSGVKSFAAQYDIPEKAVIFAIGETTANAVQVELKQDAVYSKNSDLESLIQLIKTYFNAEK